MDPPIDPGGTNNTIVGHYVTISANESVDTDGSVVSLTNSTKRKRLSAKPSVCRHCNKRRRKHGGKKDVDCDCMQEMCTISTASMSDPKHTIPNSSTPLVKTLLPSTSSVARLQYISSDAAPYTVHIQREHSNNDGAYVNSIVFGRFLKRNAFKSIVNGSLKKIGRNKLSIDFNNHEDANSFLHSPQLVNEKYKAFIPTFSVTRMGVVKGIPSEWSDEEIIENITVPTGCGPVLKIRRIKRKTTVEGNVTFINTQTVIITFDGQVLPKRIFMCYTSLPVELYIYPTIICYNCCRYGHVKNLCRSKPRCYKCGQEHTGDSCTASEESLFCCLCKGSHEAVSKKCLEFDRQKSIKESMAKSCISYSEACKKHPPISRRSYAETLLSSPKFPIIIL